MTQANEKSLIDIYIDDRLIGHVVFFDLQDTFTDSDDIDLETYENFYFEITVHGKSIVNQYCYRVRKQTDSTQKVESIITAEEARNLSGQNSVKMIKDAIKHADTAIRDAASNQQSQVIVRGDFWTHGGYNKTEEFKSACIQLEELGYSVEYILHEGTRIVW